MQFSKNTSTGSNKSIVRLLIKGILILFILIGSTLMLSKIDFPSPSNEIEKIIPNEKIKIVK